MGAGANPKERAVLKISAPKKAKPRGTYFKNALL
jgi:hypothetical protein